MHKNIALKLKIIFFTFLLLAYCNTTNVFSQNILDGHYLVQELQIRIPLVRDFPKVLVNVSFGIEMYKDSKNLSIGRGFGIILSGTYVKSGSENFGAFGGGIYARNRIGYKVGENDSRELNQNQENQQSADIHYVLSSPELSFIYLFGSDENYALLELGTDIGYGYYLGYDDYLFTCDMVRLGVRPGNDDKLFFATSYPRIGILTKEKTNNE
ncbi:hypothetical protein JW935_22470 [candidate division KSB1 bacterium]|nr:hypothetical protein [candidate division KSB1 bacterium]